MNTNHFPAFYRKIKYPDQVKSIISQTFHNYYDPMEDWYCGYVIVPHSHPLSKIPQEELYEFVGEITYKEVIDFDVINNFILQKNNNYNIQLVREENKWLPDGPGIDRVEEGMVMFGFDTNHACLNSIRQDPEKHEKYVQLQLKELRDELEKLYLENVNKI